MSSVHSREEHLCRRTTRPLLNSIATPMTPALAFQKLGMHHARSCCAQSRIKSCDALIISLDYKELFHAACFGAVSVRGNFWVVLAAGFLNSFSV